MENVWYISQGNITQLLQIWNLAFCDNMNGTEVIVLSEIAQKVKNKTKLPDGFTLMGNKNT